MTLEKSNGSAHDEEAFRPGESFEFNFEGLPHGAARPVGADQPAAGSPVCGAVAANREFDARFVLPDAQDGRIEGDRKFRPAAQLIVQNTGQPKLLGDGEWRPR